MGFKIGRHAPLALKKKKAEAQHVYSGLFPEGEFEPEE